MRALLRFLPALLPVTLLLGCPKFQERPLRWEVELPGSRVAVLPVINASGRPEHDWVVDGLMEMMAETLNSTEGIRMVDSVRLQQALEARQLDPRDSETRPYLRDLALALGAELTLDVELRRAAARDDEELYALDLRLQTADGREAARGTFTGSEPAAIAADLTLAVAEGLAPVEIPVRLSRVFSTSAFLNRLYGMGIHHWRASGPQAAEPYFKIAVAARPSFLAARGRLMDLALLSGREQEARELAVEILDQAQARGETRVQLRCIRTLALVTENSGRPDDAERLIAQAASLAETLGDEVAEIELLQDRVRLARRQRQLNKAEERLQRILDLRERRGDRLGRAETLVELGALSLDRRRYDEAEPILAAALELVRELSDPWREMAVLTELGRLARSRGDLKAAEQHWLAAADFYAARDARQERMRVSHYLAGLFLARRDDAAAEERLRDVLDLSAELGDEELEATTTLRLMQMLLRQGYPLQARNHLSRILELDRHLEPLRVQRVIAWLAYEQEKLRLARDTLATAKRQAGDRWTDRDESFLAVYEQALAEGQRLPLPFEEGYEVFEDDDGEAALPEDDETVGPGP